MNPGAELRGKTNMTFIYLDRKAHIMKPLFDPPLPLGQQFPFILDSVPNCKKLVMNVGKYHPICVPVLELISAAKNFIRLGPLYSLLEQLY